MANRNKPKSLESLLIDERSQFNQLANFSKTLQKLTHHLRVFVGATIADNCRISNYRNHTLVLEASSATFVMRLKFQREQILSHFKSSLLPNLVNVEIRVNPEIGTVQQQPEEKPNAQIVKLSEETIDHLVSLADSATTTRLKNSLLKFDALRRKK